MESLCLLVKWNAVNWWELPRRLTKNSTYLYIRSREGKCLPLLVSLGPCNRDRMGRHLIACISCIFLVKKAMFDQEGKVPVQECNPGSTLSLFSFYASSYSVSFVLVGHTRSPSHSCVVKVRLRKEKGGWPAWPFSSHLGLSRRKIDYFSHGWHSGDSSPLTSINFLLVISIEDIEGDLARMLPPVEARQ